MPDKIPEILPLINERDEVVGSCTKEEAHAKGLLHRICAVMLENENGEFLIPTASEIKVDAGKLYHAAAGHVRAKETYLEAAGRELLEETGIAVRTEDLRRLGAYWIEVEYSSVNKEKARAEIFLANYSPRMGEIILNEEQVKGVWLSKKRLAAIYQSGASRFSVPFRLTCEKLLNIF